MPVLKFYDPATLTWEEVSTAGPPGPTGSTGPQGAVGPDEVHVSPTPPTLPGVDLWVDESMPTPPNIMQLNELTDVDLATTSAVNGSTLMYNSATGQWVPGTPSAVDLSGLVKKSGDTMTGDLTIVKANATLKVTASSGNSYLMIDGPGNAYRGIRINTGASLRWFLFGANTPAEDGTGAGSDLNLYRYDDGAANGKSVLSFNRKTGTIATGTESTLYFQKQPDITPGISMADCIPTAPWVHLGGAYGNMKVTRFGPIVIMQGVLKNTVAGTSVQGWVTVGTCPAGFAPTQGAVQGAGTLGGSYPIATYVSTGGTIQVRSAEPTVTAAAIDSTVSINLVWRATP